MAMQVCRPTCAWQDAFGRDVIPAAVPQKIEFEQQIKCVGHLAAYGWAQAGTQMHCTKSSGRAAVMSAVASQDSGAPLQPLWLSDRGLHSQVCLALQHSTQR